MKRSSTIDVIKGICIIFIVITHFEWTSEQRLQYLFPFWIDMAVPMFMIITGYLYTKSNCSKNVYSFKENYSLEIIGSKLIRYTIPFTIAYVIQLSIWILKNKDMTVGAVIKDFIRGGAGPGSYYYPILVQLVFIFPIIFYIVKEYNTKGLCICGFMNIAYEVLQSTYGMTENLYRLLIFRYIFLVAFGVYISQNKINKKAGGFCYL